MNAQKSGAAAAWADLRVWSALLLSAERSGQRAGRREAERLWTERERRDAAAAEAGELCPLAYLAAAFGLSRPESQLLALALLAKADAATAEGLRALSPRGGGALTAQLAARLAAGPEGGPEPTAPAALDSDGPLLSYCLEEGPDHVLHPARRIAEFALAGRWNDPGVPGLTLVLPEEDAVPPAIAELAARMDAFLAGGEERVTFLLQGRTGAGRRTLARALCRRRRVPLLLADGHFLSGDAAGRTFRRAAVRESLLQGCPVCYTGLDDVFAAAGTEAEAAEELAELLREAAAAAGFSLLVCPEGECCWEEAPGWRTVPVMLPLPTLEESRRLWETLLARYPLSAPQDAGELAGKYRFTPGQMERAADAALSLARWQGLAAIDSACLTRGCRRQLRHALGERARLVESVFTWDDLILPEAPKALLRSACDQVRCRPQVLDAWGFGRRLSYGAGLSLLFSGPPGTGKTMAAQVAAGELGLELYKVDLAAVVSKYVGETEKNLSEIFREAARSQAILFFDEADVLFSKRTEVKDAHDKYNNMEAAYLLQKIEEYPGLSVLATNFLQNVDEAFKRRLKFIIEFPFPDAHYRLLLWRAVFPPQTPLEPDIDWEFLAQQFELSGSGIKNTAVNAAYLAAGSGTAVGMAQLLTALRRELMKSGKLLRREDFGAYYMLVE